MSDNLYRQTLDTSKSELDSLLQEETTLEGRLSMVRERMESLRKTILALGDLLGEKFEPEVMGITDAIRKVMEERKGFLLSATGVRGALVKDEFPLSDYKNPLAVIHTTLKRLEDQREVSSQERNGKTFYQWIKKEITDDDIPF